MPAIPEKTVEDVRQRSDIVQVIESYLPLKRRGADYWACCPFHQEKSPSFKVSAARQAFYCFGCKKSGNVFHFIMERENTDFPGSVRLLAKRLGIVITEERPSHGSGTASGTAAAPGVTREHLYDLLAAVEAWYREQLRDLPEAEKVRLYLQNRGIPADIVTRFGLGYSPDSWDTTLQWGLRQRFSRELLGAAGLLVQPDDQQGRVYDRFRGRLMFPIWDETGRVVGFSARTLEKEVQGAKYVNTPETPVFHKGRLLYALHLARQSFKSMGSALICEGQFDVIACHRAGMTNAVAPQGTAFTETHAQLLKRFTDQVTFAFDADPAGEKAALRSIEVAIAANLLARVVVLPKGDDPDSLFRSRGAEALTQALQTGRDAVEHVIAYGQRQYPGDSPEAKSKVAEMVLGVVARLPNPVARATYCQKLSHELNLPERAIFDSLNQVIRGQRRQGFAGPAAAAAAPPAATAAVAAVATLDNSTPLQRKAEQMLLDLVLHHEAIAGEVAAQLHPEQVSASPVGQALNQVLGMAAQGEWQAAGAEITRHPELASTPEIARILTATEFPPAATALDSYQQDQFDKRLRKAMSDCLQQVKMEVIRREMQQVQAAMQRETDPAKASALAHRFQALVRERRGPDAPAAAPQAPPRA